MAKNKTKRIRKAERPVTADRKAALDRRERTNTEVAHGRVLISLR